MPNPTTVATANHPHPRIADLPVLASPERNSNVARACIAALDVSPAVRLTGYAIADCAAIHPRSTTFRHIQAGDCAAFPAGETIRRTRRGRVTIRTIRNHIEALVIAGLERRRTVRTNTYVFMYPEQQKAPGIRAEIAENCTPRTPLCSPDCTLNEPRREDLDQDQKNVARDPSTATTTTTTTAAVRTDADSTGRDPGPSCAPETSPAPAKAKPATAAQLVYVAFLAGKVWATRPDTSTLTTRSADALIRDLKPRYARFKREERRDRRCHPVPSAVREQIARTDRSAPIHGCPASVRRARIDVLEVTLEQWRSRTNPATVQEWERELAAAITEEDRHREGLRPPGSCAAGSPPATTCNGSAAKVLAALEQRILAEAEHQSPRTSRRPPPRPEAITEMVEALQPDETWRMGGATILAAESAAVAGVEGLAHPQRRSGASRDQGDRPGDDRGPGCSPA